MIRTFETHRIRAQRELTGILWQFTPCEGEFAGKTYQVPVPSCWESYPDFSAYRGEGIYRTTFTAGGNIHLEFKGVSHTATVTLDGKEIARHYDAFTIFHANVPGLPEGEHTLEIRVDNRFSEASALHIPNDYMTYGGINRPVVLEQVSDVYVRWIHVTPSCLDDSWHARVEICLINISSSSHKVSVKAELAGETIDWQDIHVDAGKEVVISSVVRFPKIKKWAPESPVLYEVTATVFENGAAIDDLIDRTGFREIKIEGKEILLNGRAIRVKGFCRHEDHPQFCCALPYQAIAADLEMVRHLGANSIRTTHYPNDEVFLDLCDEQGILVWEENHARGLSVERMKNPNFERQAEDCIREMIPAHYNHPCIYIWGILNECASDTEYGRECYARQYALIRELDQSRPRSSATCRYPKDICLDLPEVLSFNMYPQWYNDDLVEEFLDKQYEWVQNSTKGSGKPFLVTEIGAGAIYGYRTPARSKWSEEYQAETLSKQIRAVLSRSDWSGMYIWQFCDVRVCNEWFSSRPRTMNNKGIVDEYRRRKLSYDIVKKLYDSWPTYKDQA